MLRIQDVTVRFGPPGTPNAIENVSLDVPEGRRTMIIGESGSGKSVLLMAILQMLPASAAVSGRAELDGLDLMAAGKTEMRRLRGRVVSYIPQGSGNSMNPLLTVGFQVGEPLMIHRRFSRRAAVRRACEALRSFDLGNEEQLVRQYPHTLSGGMKQRALIAMGVVNDAPVLFADEPTKGLDRARISMVTDAFRRLEGKTLLCVTHDLNFAQELADQVVVMYASEEIECGGAADFFARPLHPYSQAILRALPKNGLHASAGFAPPREDEEAARGCHYRMRCPYCTEKCGSRPPMFEAEGRKVRCWRYAPGSTEPEKTL